MNSWKVNYKAPNRIFQYFAAASACLSVMGCGMHYGWPSPSLPKLLHQDSPIPMTSEQSSWVVVILLFGSIIGSNMAIPFVDKIGRKAVLLITAIPMGLSWIMMAFANSIPLLIIARFIAGLADGATFCVLPIYITEISDPKIRGLLGSWIAVAQFTGVLLMNVIGSFLSLTKAPLICLTAPSMLLLTFAWMPESPYYLIMKGNSNQARRNLRVLKGTEDVEQEFNRLTKAIEQQNTNTGKFLDLFTVKSNKKALGLTIGIRNTSQFAGTIAIMFYAQTIFKEAGGISPMVGASIYFGVQILILSCSSIFVDKIGRKPLLLISITGAGLSLLVEGSYFYFLKDDTNRLLWLPIVALVTYVTTFSIGMQPLPTVIIGELFPTNVKAFASSLSSNYFCISGIVVSKFFQLTKDHFGMHVPFFFFATCCGFGFIFIKVCMLETKGKTLEDIQVELGNKTRNVPLAEMKVMVEKPSIEEH